MILRLAFLMALATAPLAARDIPLPAARIASPSLASGFSIAAAEQGFFATWETSRGVQGQRLTADGVPADPLALRLDGSDPVGATFAVRGEGAWLAFWSTSTDLRVATLKDDGGLALQVLSLARIFDVVSNGSTVLLAVRDTLFGVGLRIYSFEEGRLLRAATISDPDVVDARLLRTDEGFELWWQPRMPDGSIRIEKHRITSSGSVGAKEGGLAAATLSNGPIGVAASGTSRLVVFREAAGPLNARILRPGSPATPVDLGLPANVAGEFRVASDSKGWWVMYRAASGSARPGTHLARVSLDGRVSSQFLSPFSGDLAIATHALRAGALWEDGTTMVAGVGDATSGIRRTAVPGEGAASQHGERAFSTPAGGLVLWKEWDGSAWSLRGAWVIDRVPAPEVETFHVADGLSAASGFDAAWDGTDAVVTWRSGEAPGVERVLARRFRPGSSIDPAPLEIARGYLIEGPAIASAGDGTSLVSWTAERRVFHSRFAHGVPAAAPVEVPHATAAPGAPDLAWSGAHYLLVWPSTDGCPEPCGERSIRALTVAGNGHPVGDAEAIGAGDTAAVAGTGNGWLVLAERRELIRVDAMMQATARAPFPAGGDLERHPDGSVAIALDGVKLVLDPATLSVASIRSIPLAPGESAAAWFLRPLRAGGFEDLALVRTTGAFPLVARTFSPSARRADLRAEAALENGPRRLVVEIVNRGPAAVEQTSIWLSFSPAAVTAEGGTVERAGGRWRLDAPLAPGGRVKVTIPLGETPFTGGSVLVAPVDAIDAAGGDNLLEIAVRRRDRPVRR